MTWSESELVGPDGEDWRVPVSELSSRQEAFADLLGDRNISGALIQHPVDLYYFSGTRQNSTLYIPSTNSQNSIESGGSGPIQFVRRSLKRAKWESGGDNAPHILEEFPRMSVFEDKLKSCGIMDLPSMQLNALPYNFVKIFTNKLSGLNSKNTPPVDNSNLIHTLREIKSDWEIDVMKTGAAIQMEMFEAVSEIGTVGVSELDIAATAEAVSKSYGFGGNISIRRYPMQCDRAVVVAGRSGGIPSFFDAAVGGIGPHPGASHGAGFNRVKENEPVLVDLVHVHRGYVVDMTRMFVAGNLSQEWEERLEATLDMKDLIVDSLSKGNTCEQVWNESLDFIRQTPEWENHLMGIPPDQSKFLGHGVGLELDESPVIASGFSRELPIGGTMAIEPKLVFTDGCIGNEDTWIRNEEGVEPITAHAAFPWIHQWD